MEKLDANAKHGAIIEVVNEIVYDCDIIALSGWYVNKYHEILHDSENVVRKQILFVFLNCDLKYCMLNCNVLFELLGLILGF